MMRTQGECVGSFSVKTESASHCLFSFFISCHV